MLGRTEINFQTTLLVRDTCLCLHVQRAARVLARRFDEALKPAGLTNGQFSLLMSLNRPNLPGIPRATMGSVAELLGMDRTTLTASVKTLARRGLLKIKVDPGDRRGKFMLLTSKGLAALAAATPIWTETHRQVERELHGDPEHLRNDLNALARADAPYSPTSARAKPS